MKKGFHNVVTLTAIIAFSVGCTTTHEQSGTLAGAAIGEHMDELDRMKTSSILETNQANAPTSRVNPGTQHNYTVSEGPCREFTLDAQLEGSTEQI